MALGRDKCDALLGQMSHNKRLKSDASQARHLAARYISSGDLRMAKKTAKKPSSKVVTEKGVWSGRDWSVCYCAEKRVRDGFLTMT